jgi:hypothetical protein
MLRSASMRHWESLAPGRAQPTSIDALVAALPKDTAPTVESVLESLARAVEKHFPENIFVDLDRLAWTLAETVQREGAAAARDQGERLVRLHSLFGEKTAIRFRYVHDFLYGFDWAKWVGRDPGRRASVGPFDRPFLEHSEARARELLQLIAEDDPKYGLIEPREHRNPFPFRRDPESERALLAALAADGAIPVTAWRSDVPVRWDRPYAMMREAKARALGLQIAV